MPWRLVILSELAAGGEAFLRGTLRRNPGRSILDRVLHVGRAVQLGVEVFVSMLCLGAERDRAIAEQQALALVFVGEMIIDGFGTHRATHGINENLVAY